MLAQRRKKVGENSIMATLPWVEGMQGLKPSIYKGFSARLEVMPCYMSRTHMQISVLTHALKPRGKSAKE